MAYPSKPIAAISSAPPPAKVRIDAALDDPEEGLTIVPAAFLAARRPAGGPRQRPFDLFPCCGIGDALVEAHHDVAAEGLLDLHGRLGAEKMARAVDMGLKGRPLLGDLPQGAQAVDLESAAVGQDGAGPVHEPVQAAELGDQSMSRPQIEMVGVAEDDLRAQVADLLRRQRLDGALGAHRHEGRRRDLAVRRLDLSRACAPQAGSFAIRLNSISSAYKISMQSP